MLTYSLLKTQSMLSSETSRTGWPDADLHPVQNPEYPLVSNKQEGPARSLTFCPKPRAFSCQHQAGRASQMPTYKLFKTRACSCQHQAGRASQMLTHQLFKTRAPSSQQQAGIPSQMPTYKLFKIQSMFLSGTSRKGQPDADLQSVKNPEHALVRYK